MERRSFIRQVGTGLVAGAVAAPAIVHAQAPVKWRLTSSFPKSLDTIYGAAEVISKRVAAATGGNFQLQVFAAGEIVPGTQVLDAVANGTVECGHTANYYYFGKDPTFAFDCAIPFGLTFRQFNAWYLFGGGRELIREFFAGHGVLPLLAGNTGAQMGGWFRKEIKTVEDMQGVKMRIGGFAGKVMSKLGVVPQQIAGGDIYPALEKGTIDAAEWVGPYDDEKLGFNKVAQYYYYPGWWEGGPNLSLDVNIKAWESLSPEYQNILEAACYEAHVWMMAKYDAENPSALKRLIAGGTQLKAYPREVLEACHKAAMEVFEETSAANDNFRKIYESYSKFQADAVLWNRVADNTFDSFMIYMASRKKS